MMSALSTLRGRMLCKNIKKACIVSQPSILKSKFEKDDVKINVMRHELSEISQVAYAMSDIESEIKKVIRLFFYLKIIRESYLEAFEQPVAALLGRKIAFGD